jgi:hypothetical protein
MRTATIVLKFLGKTTATSCKTQSKSSEMKNMLKMKKLDGNATILVTIHAFFDSISNQKLTKNNIEKRHFWLLSP